MTTSSYSPSSALSTTVSQVAAQNPNVAQAVAQGSIDSAILSNLGSGGANLSGTLDQLSALTGAQNAQTDPTTQILNAVNANLGQNLNIKA